MKMGPIGLPKTSVTNHQTQLQNITEEWKPQPEICSLRTVVKWEWSRTHIRTVHLLWYVSWPHTRVSAWNYHRSHFAAPKCQPYK